MQEMHGGGQNTTACTHRVQMNGRTCENPTVTSISPEDVQQSEQVAGILGVPRLAGIGKIGRA